MLDAKQRGLSLTEILALHHLPDEGLVFDEALAAAWLDDQLGINQGLTAFHAEGDATARLEVQPMGSVVTSPPILVRGDVTARLRSTCVRCLAEVLVGLSVRIEQMLFSVTIAAKDPDDAEGSMEALDEGAYTKDGVDLPNVIREAMLLEISMNATCEDEAACDTRTQKLIADANEKHSPAIDPRWAALQELVKKSPS